MLGIERDVQLDCIPQREALALIERANGEARRPVVLQPPIDVRRQEDGATDSSDAEGTCASSTRWHVDASAHGIQLPFPVEDRRRALRPPAERSAESLDGCG